MPDGPCRAIQFSKMSGDCRKTPTRVRSIILSFACAAISKKSRTTQRSFKRFAASVTVSCLPRMAAMLRNPAALDDPYLGSPVFVQVEPPHLDIRYQFARKKFIVAVKA